MQFLLNWLERKKQRNIAKWRREEFRLEIMRNERVAAYSRLLSDCLAEQYGEDYRLSAELIQGIVAGLLQYEIKEEKDDSK